jgi:hypothetical protein
MAIYTIDESQSKAAKVVGFTYLFALVTANFAEFYVRGHLIVAGNAAQTARNIMAQETLFRLGIASDLITYAADVVLLVALYVILKPINPSLALLAAFWRLVETSIFIASSLVDFDALRALGTDDYLRGFGTDQLQVLARLSIGAHGAEYIVGLMFFGLGSTVFSYLWFKSRYIPRALAAWGVFSSSLVAACSFVIIIFPGFADIATPGFLVPIAIFELTMGFWLLIKGLRPAEIGWA